MPRPEYLPCIMTPGIIRSIREDQAHYDEDPERAEQEQREEQSRREEEQQRDIEEERRQ